MRKGETKSGFKFEVDEKLLDDMELLEALTEAEEESYKIPKVLKMFLGEEQKERLYNHVRTKKGTVPIKKATDEFIEIMTLAGEESKNS